MVTSLILVPAFILNACLPAIRTHSYAVGAGNPKNVSSKGEITINVFSNAAPSVVEIPTRELSNELHQTLASTIPDKAERHATIRQLLDYYLEVDATDYVLNTMCTIERTVQKKISDAVSRLKMQEPIQYILERVYFAGNIFKVTPAVLIPRPETEEWVTFLMHHVSHPTSILDIGTGSGCIAITLKQRFPQAVVDAIDISKEALTVARYNAAHLGVQVHFIEVDILTQPLPSRKWSLIVSNPPYVRMREKLLMHSNVLDYEPHLALFVNDTDPLLFYMRITYLAACHLHLNGTLCLEINEAFGEEVVDLLRRANFKQISLHTDIYKKERWVTAVLERKLNT